jgi:hypothetical protein
MELNDAQEAEVQHSGDPSEHLRRTSDEYEPSTSLINSFPDGTVAQGTRSPMTPTPDLRIFLE